MVGMKDVVEAVREANLDDVKIIIGGAPVTQEHADQIGADAPDAGSAVEVARRVLAPVRPLRETLDELATGKSAAQWWVAAALQDRRSLPPPTGAAGGPEHAKA